MLLGVLRFAAAASSMRGDVGVHVVGTETLRRLRRAAWSSSPRDASSIDRAAGSAARIAGNDAMRTWCEAIGPDRVVRSTGTHRSPVNYDWTSDINSGPLARPSLELRNARFTGSWTPLGAMRAAPGRRRRTCPTPSDTRLRNVGRTTTCRDHGIHPRWRCERAFRENIRRRDEEGGRIHAARNLPIIAVLLTANTRSHLLVRSASTATRAFGFTIPSAHSPNK